MKIQVGDIIKGTPASTKRYGITTEDMTKAVVTKANGDDITVKILEHNKNCSGNFTVRAAFFDVIGHVKKFNREEVIKLLKNGHIANAFEYDLRDADFKLADLRGVNLSCANLRGADFRAADLRGADFRGADCGGADCGGADLRGANIDYSCFPLWCGGLRVKVDNRIARQLAYHFCALECDDEEFIQARNSIINFANRFHGAVGYGLLEKI